MKCRIDHYQTPSTVHVSVFAKKVVREKSSVRLEAGQVFTVPVYAHANCDTESISFTAVIFKVHLDLLLPDNKRFEKSLSLYGPIDPSVSSFTYFGTKVSFPLLLDFDA